MVHSDPGSPLAVGMDSTMGHRAILQDCTGRANCAVVGLDQSGLVGYDVKWQQTEYRSVMPTNPRTPGARAAIDVCEVSVTVKYLPGADLPWLAVVRRYADNAVVETRSFATKADAVWFSEATVIRADNDGH